MLCIAVLRHLAMNTLFEGSYEYEDDSNLFRADSGYTPTLNKLRTDLGEVSLLLRPDSAPRTVEHVCAGLSQRG